MLIMVSFSHTIEINDSFIRSLYTYIPVSDMGKKPKPASALVS